MIKMIAAVSNNSVIGQNNDLPWSGKYKSDMQFFRKMTAGGTVIMGKNTFVSLGSKPLPKRRNIIITRSKIDNIETYNNLKDAIINVNIQEGAEMSPSEPDTWLIGGAGIYREGLEFASEIFLTLIPEIVNGDNLTIFPWIDPSKFQVSEFIDLEDGLKVAKYIRI